MLCFFSEPVTLCTALGISYSFLFGHLKGLKEILLIMQFASCLVV